MAKESNHCRNQHLLWISCAQSILEYLILHFFTWWLIQENAWCFWAKYSQIKTELATKKSVLTFTKPRFNLLSYMDHIVPAANRSKERKPANYWIKITDTNSCRPRDNIKTTGPMCGKESKQWVNRTERCNDNKSENPPLTIINRKVYVEFLETH